MTGRGGLPAMPPLPFRASCGGNDARNRAENRLPPRSGPAIAPRTLTQAALPPSMSPKGRSQDAATVITPSGASPVGPYDCLGNRSAIQEGLPNDDGRRRLSLADGRSGREPPRCVRHPCRGIDPRGLDGPGGRRLPQPAGHMWSRRRGAARSCHHRLSRPGVLPARAGRGGERRCRPRMQAGRARWNRPLPQ
jgi:hypothetical protein